MKEKKTKPRRAGDLVEGLATDGAGRVHPQVGGDAGLGWVHRHIVKMSGGHVEWDQAI